MSNSLTNKGQQFMLAGADGITRVGTKIKLYTNASTPLKDGTGFVEVANGNGYATGGLAVTPFTGTIPAASLPATSGNWSIDLDTGDIKAVLDDKQWTASAGSIANIAGAYMTDASDVILAWWERGSTTTIASGDTVTLTGLFIKLA
jgi:hypothetical protein